MTHEEKLQQIELDTAEIKKQMMLLEFQNKKEMADFRKESEERWQRIEKQNELANKKIQYLIDATGVIFQEITQIDTEHILERNK